MNAAKLAAPDHPGAPAHQITFTLEPIRAEGSDALAPDPPDGILSAKLVRLDVIWENAMHEITTYRAEDLFHCAEVESPLDNPVPNGAEPIHATLSIRFKGSPKPHRVDIWPPHTLKLQRRADAPRIRTFLSKRRFAR